MSGHSKWHNIQAKKGKADAARGKIFTKLGRELLIAVKAGGPDPAGNSKLKDVIAKCKAANMPNDTINNAIKKAAGAGNNENYEEIIYEGYGPNGVAVIVEASTDNKNRTAADVRHAFDKAGGNLGTTGCVSYLFSKKGVIVIDKTTTNLSEDDMMMLALDNGAEDFESSEECYEITTLPEDFSKVREALEAQGLEFLEAEVQMVPATYISLEEADGAKMQRLLDMLEDLDDVMNVYHNWEELS
ncbi:MAG: YebC/PmpR family DNA-binding transcriptional regulator [Clostridia bacterium]|nr:YebC/PmpR family DNA-binding transcriptional regulator [Clostridia bacterium]